MERERAARLREIARAEEEYVRSNGLRGLTEAEGEQLRLKQTELTEQKAAVVEWERRRDIAARHLNDDEDAARASIELLDIDAQMVRTNRERVRIEREILLATIEIARKRKQAELDTDPELTEDDRKARMGTFDRSAGRQVEVFDHRESERLRAQFKGYGREVVQAIQDGRIGEYIGDKIKERLIDGALDQLFDLFKSGGGGGAGGGFFGIGGKGGGAIPGQGGGWMQTAFKFASSMFGGPRAGGGGTEAGRFYTTVEHGRPELMMIGGNPNAVRTVTTEAAVDFGFNQFTEGAAPGGERCVVSVEFTLIAGNLRGSGFTFSGRSASAALIQNNVHFLDEVGAGTVGRTYRISKMVDGRNGAGLGRVARGREQLGPAPHLVQGMGRQLAAVPNTRRV